MALYDRASTQYDVSFYDGNYYDETSALASTATVVLPVAFLTTFPAEAILGDLKFNILFFGLLLSSIFFIFSRVFWKFALKHYTSASS